ncbi:hypothetical protein M8494_03740 [Serratia ureilytica]
MDVAYGIGLLPLSNVCGRLNVSLAKRPTALEQPRDGIFPTQIPPYGIDKKPIFYHTVMPDDIELLNGTRH